MSWLAVFWHCLVRSLSLRAPYHRWCTVGRWLNGPTYHWCDCGYTYGTPTEDHQHWIDFEKRTRAERRGAP